MENPTFHLEGVVRVRDDMEDFEGPLTLILQLLSKNKVEIQDIQISLLLDQYTEYLDRMKSMDLEIASEFVAMASHLVYIKARTLLNAGEENPELEELISSLDKLKNQQVYDSIREVSPMLAALYQRGAGTLTKPPEPLAPDKEYRYQHEKTDLLDAMLRLWSREELERLTSSPRPVPMPKRITYPVTEKTEELLRRLRSVGSERLSDIFHASASRTELVATFIVLLELCRSGSIALSDGGPEDGDVLVTYVEGDPGEV